MSLLLDRRSPVRSAAAAGLWALPIYGVLLGLSTLTHQPPVSDFDAYARYVTTGMFLVSHLVASIFGAALAVVGVVAAGVFLVRSPAVRTAITGVILTAVSQVLMASAFGSAAFVQPGIGRAHLRGAPDMPALNADTAYGPPLVGTIAVASLLFIAAAIVTGIAIARTNRRLRWLGVGYAVLLPLFVFSGLFLHLMQPVAGFAFAAVTAVLARLLPRAAPDREPAG